MKSSKVGVRIAVLAVAIAVLFCACDPIAVKNYITTKTVGVIHVSITTGSDSNPGTASEPMQSIDAAIDYLVDNDIEGRVNVAEGTYSYQSYIATYGTHPSHEYLDAGDNEEWQTTEGSAYVPAFKIKCPDGEWYNLDQTYYHGT